MTRHPRRHPRGYVLLLTLLLLAIAATALAGVCRASLRQAVHASHAQEELQRRWTTLSCRTALLPKAAAVFDASPRPISEVVMRFELGGQPVTLTFGDEQAKANVNLLYATGQRAGATRAVRELVRASGASERVELRPMLPDESVDASEPPAERSEDDGLYVDLDVQPLLASWGQVFPSASPDELLRRRATLPPMTANLTCWGDGTLNARRASRDAILQVCDRVLRPTEVTKLLTARDKDPAAFDLWEAIDELELPEGRAADAQQVLTDRSNCYALWIETWAGGRARYHLAAADFLPDGGGMTGSAVTFEW